MSIESNPVEPNATIEVADFYEPRNYITEEGDEYWVSTYGIKLGNTVISVVNGTLCSNPFDDEPYAINFDGLMFDLLPTTPVTPELVMWDPAMALYRPIQ